MLAAGVPHQHRLPLDAMAPISCTPVDSVLVVEAPADRVELNDLVAHLGKLTQESSICVRVQVMLMLAFLVGRWPGDQGGSRGLVKE